MTEQRRGDFLKTSEDRKGPGEAGVCVWGQGVLVPEKQGGRRGKGMCLGQWELLLLSCPDTLGAAI